MSFLSKTDKFGIADASVILTSVEEGDSIQEVTAAGEDGSIVASETYGSTSSPSCEYVVKSSLASSAKDIILGGVTTVGTSPNQRHFCLTEVSIETSAGSTPTISAKGEEVPYATPSCTYTIDDGLNIVNKAHAQVLANAFEYSGNGVHMTDCSATFSCSFQSATKDGDIVAWDVTEGKIEVEASFVQTGATEATVSPKSGWTITSPLTKSSPDANFPTWSVTLVKYLSKDAESESESEG